MKFPYLLAHFATMSDAVAKRDELNKRKQECTDDTEVIIKRGPKSWDLYKVMKTAPAVRQKPRHDESEIQRACVEWFKIRYRNNARLLFAVPNGGNRNPREAAIMKREGVTAGVADLLLLIPSGEYHGLAIEMKTATGRQSPEQKSWQELVECNGYRYQVCRSLAEFRETIEEYMPTPPRYLPARTS